MEIKTYSKPDKDQLERHKKLLLPHFEFKISYWEGIHDYFDKLIKNDNSIQGIDLFLIQQFIKYLELISLSSFNGWKDEDFDFFFLYEKDKNEVERIKSKIRSLASEVLEIKELSDILEDKGIGTLRIPSTHIWYQLDIKDKKFFINDSDPYLNFTMELLPSSFQVTIVFPVFPSIDKLREVLKVKKPEIVKRFNEVLKEKILKTCSHEYLTEFIRSKSIVVEDVPNYKIRIYDHSAIKRGERHWIPKAELTFDPQTLKNDYWYDFLENLINLYHPPRPLRESNWGAGLHILKQYPRASEIISDPKNLIKDVQETFQDFLKIVEVFV